MLEIPVGWRCTALLGVVWLLAGCAASGFRHDVQQEGRREVARRMLEERLGQGRIEALAHLVSPDFVASSPTRPDRAGTLEEDVAAIRGWRSCAPDLRVVLHRSVVEGEWVATLWRATGTNTGEGNGWPATGRTFDVAGTTFFRIRDGRNAEEWTVVDLGDLHRQLGLAAS